MTTTKGMSYRARSSWITGVAIGVGLLAGSAGADWADGFDAGFGQTWFFEAVDDIGDPPTTGTSTFAIVEDGADDYLQISHTTTAARDGGGGATDGFGFVNEIFGETGISADVNANAAIGQQQNLLGVIGRGDEMNGTAYVAAVDFANSIFAIVRSDDFPTFLTPLATDTSIVIDRNETYRIEFFLLGSSLTARLIETSSGDPLSTIFAVDALYSSGIAGILVETEYDSNDFPVAPIIGTFDDVEAVPEPSTVSLLGWGVGALLVIRRRVSA